LDMPIPAVAECARETGITFLFAMTFHPAMRHVGPTRRLLGIPTAFNYLGPMTNPARVKSSAIGVANPVMAEKMAHVFAERGDHALIFRGDDGLDELTIATTSRLWEAVDGELTEYRFDPTEYGLQNAPLEQLRGGDAEYNAGIFRAILAGEGEAPKSPLRAIHDAVVMNAAAGLVAYRPTNGESFETRFTQALADARESIASGAAERVLNAWVEFSEKHAEA
ncbi:MAG: anthranilate phosphoribosyltransferase, partial [Rothia sp.]|nr:anthranilate phosphoribosyltransferase [Rothia sp. (in: high G+C Gram-positive bacteria)]